MLGLEGLEACVPSEPHVSRAGFELAHYVAEDDFELLIVLFLPPGCLGLEVCTTMLVYVVLEMA